MTAPPVAVAVNGHAYDPADAAKPHNVLIIVSDKLDAAIAAERFGVEVETIDQLLTMPDRAAGRELVVLTRRDSQERSDAMRLIRRLRTIRDVDRPKSIERPEIGWTAAEPLEELLDAFPPELATPGSRLVFLMDLPPWPEPSTAEKADYQPAGRTEGGGDHGDGKESQGETLLRLASVAELFQTPESRCFATVPNEDHRETHEIRSTGFRRWLTHKFYLEAGKAPSNDAMAGAIGTLEALATFEGETHPVYVRVAPIDGGVVVDIGDDSWQAVKITPTGWNVVSEISVRFRRPPGQTPLPIPERGGKIDDLRAFANVIDDEWPLLLAWIAAALFPRGPYPILNLNGEQGSSKSTTSRVVRRLIDPHVSPLRSEPREVRDLVIGATHNHVLAIDNISKLPDWLSDSLCRLATGGSIAMRALYTNDEETFLEAVKPQILNGIPDYASRGDLIDRVLFMHLPTIPESERRTETEFWAAFDAAAPSLFGAVLDVVRGALKLLPEIKLATLPRMADFARLGEAACQAAGLGEGTFLASYQANRDSANRDALEDSTLSRAVRQLVESRGDWSGTASDLLSDLSEIVGDETRKDRSFPKRANALTGSLRRIAPGLRSVGVGVEFVRDKHARRILLTLDPNVWEKDRHHRHQASDSF